MDYTLLFGILGGIAITRVINIASEWYTKTVVSEAERTKITNQRLTQFQTRIDEFERKYAESLENLKRQVNREVAEENAKTLTKLNLTLANFINKYEHSTSTEKGTYKTYSGVVNENHDFLSDNIDNCHSKSLNRLKEMIADIGDRKEMPISTCLEKIRD
jgi:hypothetical protein